MTNLERYNAIFIEIFQTDASALNTDFNANTIDMWDSICQLSLVTNMEDTFDVMLDPEDIIGFKSYELGKSILAKYGVIIS
jgi:acyl carrier protein